MHKPLKCLSLPQKNRTSLPRLYNSKTLKPGTEQYKYVSRAVSLGYFKTESDGSFKPNENLKRDEMGNALAVAFNLSENISADKPMMFTDMNTHEYAERINGLYYAGVTKGDGGKFLPNDLLTRSQFHYSLHAQ